jgi:hypothetical protein
MGLSATYNVINLVNGDSIQLTGQDAVHVGIETVKGEPNVLARARETGEQIFWDRQFAERVVAADGDHTLALIEHEKQSLGLSPEDYEFWSNGHVGRMGC